MSSRKRLRKTLRAGGRPTFDDGEDPRGAAAERSGGGRKARQLCAQIAETLGYVLAGECDDEFLHNLAVVDVAPGRRMSHVVVTLAPCVPALDLDPAEVAARLAAHTGRLRREVAASIHRRRTPELVFRLA